MSFVAGLYSIVTTWLSSKHMMRHSRRWPDMREALEQRGEILLKLVYTIAWSHCRHATQTSEPSKHASDLQIRYFQIECITRRHTPREVRSFRKYGEPTRSCSLACARVLLARRRKQGRHKRGSKVVLRPRSDIRHAERYFDKNDDQRQSSFLNRTERVILKRLTRVATISFDTRVKEGHKHLNDI